MDFCFTLFGKLLNDKCSLGTGLSRMCYENVSIFLAATSQGCWWWLSDLNLWATMTSLGASVNRICIYHRNTGEHTDSGEKKSILEESRGTVWKISIWDSSGHRLKKWMLFLHNKKGCPDAPQACAFSDFVFANLLCIYGTASYCFFKSSSEISKVLICLNHSGI